MIISSRGTGHLFSLSVPGGIMPKSAFSNKEIGACPSFSLVKHRPLVISAVSRIRNGEKGWLEVTSAAAAIAGKIGSPSGVTAAVFRHGNLNYIYPGCGYFGLKQQILLFSAGSIIRYVFRVSSGLEGGSNLCDLGHTASRITEACDKILTVEPVQKWDICRSSFSEEQDNFDIYGECVNSKTLYNLSAANGIMNARQNTEGHCSYVYESEFRVHSNRNLLCSNPEIYLQLMVVDDCMLFDGENNGETEIERFPTHTVESKSRSLAPASVVGMTINNT